MNLQTSVTTDIEVLRPFDRSFLMKRQSCGIDFLKKIQYKPGKFVDRSLIIFMSSEFTPYRVIVNKVL